MTENKKVVVMKDRNGDVYEGSVNADDERHGKGKLTRKNGEVYVGCFRNDEFNGEGKLRYPNGDVYEGTWRKGEQHGNGYFRAADGSWYKGGWISGKREGTGGSFSATTQRFHHGKWKAGVKHGQGKEFDKEGDEQVNVERATWVNGEKRTDLAPVKTSHLSRSAEMASKARRHANYNKYHRPPSPDGEAATIVFDDPASLAKLNQWSRQEDPYNRKNMRK